MIPETPTTPETITIRPQNREAVTFTGELLADHHDGAGNRVTIWRAPDKLVAAVMRADEEHPIVFLAPSERPDKLARALLRHGLPYGRDRSILRDAVDAAGLEG